MMNNSKQYIAIGIFVVFSIAAAIFITIWLAFGINDTKYNTYVATFHEAVDGLQLNSNVTFNGVPIGKVTKIDINHKHPGSVDVTLSIEEGTPITDHTYATLMSQGITGLSYVGLINKPKKGNGQQGDKDSGKVKRLKPSNGPPYTHIPTKPSMMTNITREVGSVAKNINKITDALSNVINKENTRKVSNILNNINMVMEDVANNKHKINNSIKNLQVTLENIQKTSRQMNRLITNIAILSENINTEVMPEVNHVLVPQLSQTLENIDAATYRMNSFMRKLNRNPSILVTGQAPLPPGPGE